jgi:hypothetical protein
VASTLMRPRPLPDRRIPAIAGGLVVLLALPIFLIGGWSVRGWALGAVLWVGSQLLGVLFGRLGINDPTLRGSGMVAFGMMGRGILVVLVAIVVAAAGDPDIAVAGILVYALAYTLELALSMTAYFSGGDRS